MLDVLGLNPTGGHVLLGLFEASVGSLNYLTARETLLRNKTIFFLI